MKQALSFRLAAGEEVDEATKTSLSPCVCVCVNGIGDSATSNCRSTPCLEIQPALRQTGLSAAPKWPKEGEKKNKATKKKWILFLYDLCALAHSGAHVMAAVANMLKLAGGLGGDGQPLDSRTL